MGHSYGGFNVSPRSTYTNHFRIKTSMQIQNRADLLGQVSKNRSPSPTTDLFGSDSKKMIVERYDKHSFNAFKKGFKLKNNFEQFLQIRDKNKCINLPFKDRSYAMAKESVTNQEMKKFQTLEPGNIPVEAKNNNA